MIVKDDSLVNNKMVNLHYIFIAANNSFMRKFKNRLFWMTFVTTTLSIGGLCVLYKQPWFLGEAVYNLNTFLNFIIFTAFLSMSLVYMCLPLLYRLNEKTPLLRTTPVFVLMGSMLILQIFTLVTGYLASAIFSSNGPSLFYYYGCVTNSCICIAVGNFVTVIASIRFATQARKIKINEVVESQISEIGTS
jgi:hypothetical protein